MRTRGLFLLAALLFACGGDTGGREVVLATTLRADPEIAASFPTRTGWTVRLTRAAASVGALYYFEGAPAFVRARPRDAKAWLAWLWPLGKARAHPGHYIAGEALGQMLVPAAADLFAGSAVLPAGNGVTGTYRSARFALAAPGDAAARASLGGDHVGFVEGVAVKGTETVHFRLGASFDEVARSAAAAQVDGCVFDETDVTGDGTVAVTVSPRVWLSLVDFTGVAPGSPEAPTLVAAGETPRIAFALGLAQLSAYHFAFAPGAPKEISR
ncbi:MAG: hypothetical protein ABW252_19280 [Polyangiales bacterium]